MKKLILSILVILFLLPSSALAQAKDYQIESFDSQISVNQDTSLTVTETIDARFFVHKHGIFRVIPVTYSANGRTIQAELKILSITDRNNNPYSYQVEHYNQSKRIKIGDPNKTLIGPQTYIIKYQIKDVLQRFPDHDEVYWNVTGSEWDTTISKATATINSPFAQITKAICYSDEVKTQQKNCQTQFDHTKASFNSNATLSSGKDLTIVVALNNQNQLAFPSPVIQKANFIRDNWGYPVALIPVTLLFFFWYKKGRDLKYLSDNVYTIPDHGKTQTAPLFAREHLPLVYSPINGLSPSEVGTIIDQRVDTKDIIAEIVELARLGYLEIKKTEKKKLFGKETDYLFIDKTKDTTKLKTYQVHLLKSLFDSKKETSLSLLKNSFYKDLGAFKTRLYNSLQREKIFDSNPEHVKGLWLGIGVLIYFLAFFFTLIFGSATNNFVPLALLLVTLVPATVIIVSMPRRTAWGYSLYRQTTGLKYYINVGKWRQEIAEKHLFLEEILPLAISLGVIGKLARDMEALALPPPSYLHGFTAAHFASDFNRFSSQAASNIVSSPHSSGRSSWSGGSGFSGGGSSGGGFGGGGGGSW
ncbi:MAG: DUF2207 domain-containing protein [Patescibacteria group bacterium]